MIPCSQCAEHAIDCECAKREFASDLSDLLSVQEKLIKYVANHSDYVKQYNLFFDKWAPKK